MTRQQNIDYVCELVKAIFRLLWAIFALICVGVAIYHGWRGEYLLGCYWFLLALVGEPRK